MEERSKTLKNVAVTLALLALAALVVAELVVNLIGVRT